MEVKSISTKNYQRLNSFVFLKKNVSNCPLNFLFFISRSLVGTVPCIEMGERIKHIDVSPVKQENSSQTPWIYNNSKLFIWMNPGISTSPHHLCRFERVTNLFVIFYKFVG